jgi:hypothetical protein
LVSAPVEAHEPAWLRLEDEAGAPARGARVVSLSTGRSTTADAQGEIQTAPDSLGAWVLVEWPHLGTAVYPAPETPGAVLHAAPPAQLGGVVRNEAGLPVAGARVSLVDSRLGLSAYPSPEEDERRERLPQTVARTNAEGHFVLQSPRAGLVALHVSAPGYAPTQSAPLQVTSGKQALVSLVAPNLAPGSLRVVDAKGRPVSGAEISGPGLPAGLRSDSLGMAPLFGAPARGWLRVSAPGYAESFLSAEAGEVVLYQAARVEGHVEGARPHEMILLSPHGEESLASAPAPQAAARFSFVLAPGEYDVLLSRPSGDVFLHSFSIREGESLSLHQLSAPPAPAAECEEGFSPALETRATSLGVVAVNNWGEIQEGDILRSVDGESPLAAWLGPKQSVARLSVARPATGERFLVSLPRVKPSTQCRTRE